MDTMKSLVDDHMTIDKRLITKELLRPKTFRTNEGSALKTIVELMPVAS